jgi:hypothetical protein
MAARLVPIARNFALSREVFTVGSRDVRSGCVAPGAHRLLRFDVLCHNAGDTDLVIGPPSARPDLFEYSTIDQRYYLHDFVHVALADAAGEIVAEGHKRSFCLMDLERIDPGARQTQQFHDCNTNQGISAGWADVYRARLPCQYLVVDDVPDGRYQLRIEIDAQRVLPDGPDSTLTLALELAGDTVAVVTPEAPAPLPGADSPTQPLPMVTDPLPPPPYIGRELSPLEVFAHVVVDSADPQAAARYLAPGFVGHGVALDRGDHALDAAGYRAVLDELVAAFSGLRTALGPQLTERDWIAAAWSRTGLHVGPFGGLAATRRPVEIRGVSIARIERGRIAEQWDVVDPSWLLGIGAARVTALEPPE